MHASVSINIQILLKLIVSYVSILQIGMRIREFKQ